MTIRDALSSYNYEVIKFVMIENHYGTDLDISNNDFDLAEKHLYYFYNTMIKSKKYIESFGNTKDNNIKNSNNEFCNNLNIKEKFEEAMDDDFGTPLAIANLYTYFKYINNLIENPKLDKQQTAYEIDSILTDIKNTYKVLGLFEQEPERYVEEVRSKHLSKMHLTIDDIRDRIAKRVNAKQNKDYVLADQIRDNLQIEGIDLRDTKEGTTWDLRELY